MFVKENHFIKKKYNKYLLTFLLGTAVTITAEMFDSFAAGTYVDTNAVIAIELLTPLEYIEYAITVLLVYGIGALYNREKGKHNIEKSQKIAGMGLLVAVVGGFLMFAIKYLFARQILGFYDCSKEVLNYALPYAKRQSIYLIPSCLYYFSAIMVLADGDEKLGAVASIVCSLLSVFLPNVLAARFGLMGIASTFAISYTCGLFVNLLHFLSKRNSIKFKLYFSFNDFIKLVKLSSAYCLCNLFVAINDIVFNIIIISQYDESHLLAYTVVNFTLNFAEVLSASISASKPFMSVAYGENNPYSIKRALVLAIKSGIVLSVVMSVALIAISGSWPTLLGIDNGEISEYAIFAGRIIPLLYIFSMFVYFAIDYYPIINKPKYGNATSIIYMMIAPMLICIPLAYFANFKALIIGFALSPVFTLLIIILYFVATKKKDAPLFLMDNGEKELIYCLKINKEDDYDFNNKLSNDFASCNFKQPLIKSIMTAIDNAIEIIKKKNNGAVDVEITVLYSEKGVRLLLKDDGKIFNLAEEFIKINNDYKIDNDVVMSFNANVFIWDFAN